MMPSEMLHPFLRFLDEKICLTQHTLEFLEKSDGVKDFKNYIKYLGLVEGKYHLNKEVLAKHHSITQSALVGEDEN